VYLIQVSLLLIGQQGLGHYFRCRPCFPHRLNDCANLCQRRRKTTNKAPTTLSAIQASSQSTYSNEHLLVIIRNDKNKQLALLSQSKTGIKSNINFLHYKIIGAPKKIINQPRSLVRPSSVNFCQFFKNLSHGTVPLIGFGRLGVRDTTVYGANLDF
jgi:hypothetical protein